MIFAEMRFLFLLGMKLTFFNPVDSVKKLCAPTEIDNYWRMKTLQGEVHDETSAMLNGDCRACRIVFNCK